MIFHGYNYQIAPFSWPSRPRGLAGQAALVSGPQLLGRRRRTPWRLAGGDRGGRDAAQHGNQAKWWVFCGFDMDKINFPWNFHGIFMDLNGISMGFWRTFNGIFLGFWIYFWDSDGWRMLEVFFSSNWLMIWWCHQIIPNINIKLYHNDKTM